VGRHLLLEPLRVALPQLGHEPANARRVLLGECEQFLGFAGL
jgi:hypothetical protein